MKQAPSQLDGATVLWWASSPSQPFFVLRDANGVSQSEIVGLAIAQYPGSAQVYRFSCDSTWEVQQDSTFPDVEAAKSSPSGNYDISLVEWLPKLSTD